VFRDGSASASFWATAMLAPVGIAATALFLVKPMEWAPHQALLAVLPLAAGFLAILLYLSQPRRWYYRPEVLPPHALPPEGKSQA